MRTRFDEGYRIDPDRIAAALRPDTLLVSIASPQNPSGVATDPDRLQAIADAVARRAPRAVLLVDECYRAAAYDGAAPAASAATPRRAGGHLLVALEVPRRAGPSHRLAGGGRRRPARGAAQRPLPVGHRLLAASTTCSRPWCSSGPASCSATRGALLARTLGAARGVRGRARRGARAGCGRTPARCAACACGRSATTPGAVERFHAALGRARRPGRTGRLVRRRAAVLPARLRPPARGPLRRGARPARRRRSAEPRRAGGAAGAPKLARGRRPSSRTSSTRSGTATSRRYPRCWVRRAS